MLMTETPPPTPPVTLAGFRAHLRLSSGFPEDAAEDALLERYLVASTAQVERQIAQVLVQRAVTLRVGCWTASGHFVLPVGPVSAIDTLAFTDGTTATAQDVSALRIEPGRSRQRLTGPAGGPLPVIPAGQVAEIGFTAGHAPSGDGVPQDLRQAVLMLAAHRFEARDGGAGAGLPPAVVALLVPHRPVRF